MEVRTMAVSDTRPLTVKEDRMLRAHPAVDSVTYTDDEIDVAFKDDVNYGNFPEPLEGLPVTYLDWDLKVVTFDTGDAK